MVLSPWPKSLRQFTRFIWWMQTERRVAANPQIKPVNLVWVRRKLAATIHIRHRHCYYYSARWVILILPSHGRLEGWVDLGTAVEVHSPCPRLYIAAAVAINTTVLGVMRTSVLSHSCSPLAACHCRTTARGSSTPKYLWGLAFSLPSFLLPHLLFSFPFPLSLEVDPLKYSYRGLGSVVSSPSGVSAEIELCAF